MRHKLLLVFGTRPEAIKMCPLVLEFRKHSDVFETLVCVTGEHREMLEALAEIIFDRTAFLFAFCVYVHNRECVSDLLDNRDGLYTRMAHAVNPYGDGKACGRVVKWLEEKLS